MGCGDSKAASPVLITASTNTTTATVPTTEFAVVVQQVKQTWPDVQKIDRFGAKVFAQ